MFEFFKRRRIDPKKRLVESLGDLSLPAFSAATMNTLRLLRNPDATPDRIAASIEINPGVVVRMLQMVNSAAYGLVGRVDRVAHALNLLGRGQVESLVVALAVKGSLDKAAKGAATAGFWRAAAERASLARGLAALLHPERQSESFVAGLLQDMAVPLLVRAQPEGYEPLVRRWLTGPGELDDLERAHYGWDHSEIGACLAAHWELPQSLAQAIGGHHDDDDSIPPAVYLASYVKQSRGGRDLEPMVYTARDRFGVAEDRVVDTINEAWARAESLASLLS
ncbi:MAG: HDOD domain-containing protein [Myxococcales bacterium]|nr:HDOD domain-containing protein [Myxococcales bacterium]